MPGKIRSINSLHLTLFITLLVLIVWSVINPRRLEVWFLELTPLLAALIVLVATYHKFRLTTPSYILIWCAAIIIAIGGHYTYNNVPLFNWIKDTWHLTRNYYDRLGHVFDGIVTSIILRELLLRKTPITRGKLLVMLILAINLGISAGYEIIEWGVALFSGSAATDFLGTQGDIWDTQWDMFLSLCGSILSLLSLSKLHNRYLKEEIGLLK